MLVLAGCAPAQSAPGLLHFTQIEQKNDPAYIGQQQYNALDPGLMVFTDPETLSEGGVWFSEAARQKMAMLDLQTHFVLAVFQGWQSGTGYGVEIAQILLEGDVVRVAAVFQVPADTADNGVTSPYQVVALRRPYRSLETLVFELVVDGEVLDVYPPTESR